MKSIDFMDITLLIIKYLQENYNTQEVVETPERRRSVDTRYIKDLYLWNFYLLPVFQDNCFTLIRKYTQKMSSETGPSKITSITQEFRSYRL